MRIFVYEYLTAGGRFLDGDQPPSGSMLLEGAAMLRAVCHDLSGIAGAQLVGLWDARLPRVWPTTIPCKSVTDARSHAAHFDRCVSESDHALLIAPEIDGRLAALTERAEWLGASLICPDSTFVRLATDKLQTIQVLRDAGVPVPATYACRSPNDVASVPSGRWVCKPVDGAGSWQVRCVDREGLAEALCNLDASADPATSVGFNRPWCVQAYCEGRPASVAALGGVTRPKLLPPCWQWLEPPTFAYRGGELIMEDNLIVRAHRLARRAFEALPAARGFIGLDLVLGVDPNGSEDVMIEVNPRLTTSYVGLRQRAVPNLGQAMWQQATGQEARLSFLPGPLQFDAAGTIRSTMIRPSTWRDQAEQVE